MDCSLREALRKEQSIAPKNAFFSTHQDQEKATTAYTRVLLLFQKQLDFLQAKEWFFWCFLRPCILGTFCCFIPCNLSRLRYMHANIADICTFSHKWCASSIEVLKMFP